MIWPSVRTVPGTGENVYVAYGTTLAVSRMFFFALFQEDRTASLTGCAPPRVWAAPTTHIVPTATAVTVSTRFMSASPRFSQFCPPGHPKDRAGVRDGGHHI
jgi:hypothetical protein